MKTSKDLMLQMADTIVFLSKKSDRYKMALIEIKQIGINNSDSVEAATFMSDIAERALNERT